MALRFDQLDFGFASAEKEGSERPELLTDGFFDLDRIRERALTGSEFLCLGYKGSGKSALSEHLRLLAKNDTQLFVSRLFLADFPFTDFGHILRGSQDLASRYPTTWSWLLYLQILGSVASDQGAYSIDPPSYGKTLDLLTRYAFLPTPDLHELVLKSSERSFRISLAKTLEGGVKGTRAATADLNFLTFVATLRTVAASVRSKSRHLLVIDGLDDILLREPVQYESLAALVVEVSRINSALREAGAPGKILLLCRNDIYDRLPGPNLNKIRQDNAIQLNWYSDPAHPERANLIAVANAKARVTDPKLQDLIAGFLPITVKDVPIRKYLLDRTRFLPRDFLQLLKAIQVAAGSQRGRIGEDIVQAGARNYGREYLLPEIRDEAIGHFSVAQRDAGFDALSRLGTARFTAQAFAQAVDSNAVPDFDTNRFLATLYDCGAIGNINGGIYTFRFRNPHVPLKTAHEVIVHRGLAPALNISSYGTGS